jgi:hypothetical protein
MMPYTLYGSHAILLITGEIDVLPGLKAGDSYGGESPVGGFLLHRAA